MSETDGSLPTGFEALEPFVNIWALDTSEKRHRRRLGSTDAERCAFFLAAKDLLAPGLDYLDKTALAGFSPQQHRLMNLFLALAQVSLAVEMQGDDETKHAASARHMTITCTPADQRPS